MAKEWILNSVANRYQLNFKRNIGATTESIRKCSPKTLDEWRKYYFTHVKSKEYIEDLGKKLYVKITEVIQSELNEIGEQDCIDYILQLVIDHTFEGYQTEKKTVHGQLQTLLNIKIESAPDKWDQLFNVDFVIKIGERYIGLRIKPVNFGIQLPKINKETKAHQKFTEKFVGKVFYIFSEKVNAKKEIVNKEIVEEIRNEIKRLINYR